MENEQDNSRQQSMLETTAHIVAAYLEKNRIPSGQIADLIVSVSKTLAQLSLPVVAEPERPVPPVNPKKSVSADFIISLEDGKPYKSLRRHLNTRGLTPDEYRKKWDLPSDYPMVAANYSAARSALAVKLGLGRKPSAPKKPSKSRRSSATDGQ